jgi:hypothetical protein
VHVPESMWGEISGLLGDADGDPGNDLVDRNGRTLSGSEVWTQVYDDDFKEAYRIRRADSMFRPEKTAFDYHADDIGKYPIEVMSLDAFAGPQLDAARQRCAATGLDGELLETCVFDVLVSGDDSYADQAARSATRARDIAHPHGTGGGRGSTGGDVILVPRPPLVEAVEQGDIAEVRRLLDRGEDIDVGRESDGLTPLITAIIMGRTEIIDLLLDRGANPNAFDDRQMGPVQLAILVGADVDLVRRLLDAGADPNTGTDSGGAGAFFTPLSAAAASGDVELAQLLLDFGADIDGRSQIDLGGWTPLYVAALQSSTDMVEFLLAAGANPNGTFRQGEEFGPLYGAVVGGRADIVRALLAAGADPRSATPGGMDITLLTSNEEIIRLLSR